MVKRTHDTAFIAGMIYFTQGALGISGIALPLYLRSLHWSIPEIASVSSLAALPWIFKIFYGYLSDSAPLLNYRRKSYLILFSLISAAGWVTLAFLPSSKHAILLALMLTNMGFAATDVITDGFVVEHSSGVASSVYQSIAWASRSAGSVISGLLSGWLAMHWKAQDIFLLTMMLPLYVCLCALLMHEKKIEPEAPHHEPPSFGRCLEYLREHNIKIYALILFLVSISSSFGVPFFFHMKETLGFPETFLGFLSSLGWAGAGIGSVLYMRVLRQFPPKTTLRWAMVFNCINILSTLLIKDQTSAFVVVFVGGAMGCLVMLPICSGVAAATHQSGMESTLFAILMSVFNIGQITFGFLGARLFNVIGLTPLIVTAGVMALMGLLVTRKVDWTLVKT